MKKKDLKLLSDFYKGGYRTGILNALRIVKGEKDISKDMDEEAFINFLNKKGFMIETKPENDNE